MFLFIYFGKGSLIASCTLSLFAFNFCVEPYDVPKDDVIFRSAFFLHHIGPVVAALVASETAHEFLLPQSLLFMHAWLLHSFTVLEWYKYISMQSIFWPYFLQGFLLKLFWCLMLPAQHVELAICTFPVFVFYIGRWGLFLRMQSLYPTVLADPKSQLYDRFNDWKQVVELGSFVLSFMLSYLLVY